MLDFIEFETLYNVRGYDTVLRPRFNSTVHTNDIIVKGNRLYAAWDESTGFWNMLDPCSVIDKEIEAFAACHSDILTGYSDHLTVSDNAVIKRELNQYIRKIGDVNGELELDQRVLFKK